MRLRSEQVVHVCLAAGVSSGGRPRVFSGLRELGRLIGLHHSTERLHLLVPALHGIPRSGDDKDAVEGEVGQTGVARTVEHVALGNELKKRPRSHPRTGETPAHKERQCQQRRQQSETETQP